MNEELSVLVSGICGTQEERYAYVSFADGERKAEGKIPDCVILSNTGFSEEEVAVLELYMKQELVTLKKMASGINPVRAFLKE